MPCGFELKYKKKILFVDLGTGILHGNDHASIIHANFGELPPSSLGGGGI